MLHSLGVMGHCMESMECVLCYSWVAHDVERSSMSFLEGMRERKGKPKSTKLLSSMHLSFKLHIFLTIFAVFY